MIVTSPVHKNLLFRLFYTFGPEGIEEKRFPLESLMVASTTLRKLRESAESVCDDKGQTVGVRFLDGDTTFTNDETHLLRDLLGSVREATPTEFELLEELKALMAPEGLRAV